MTGRKGAAAYALRRRRTAPGDQLSIEPAQVKRCPRCRGAGERDGVLCGTCGATGQVTRVEPYAAAEEHRP